MFRMIMSAARGGDFILTIPKEATLTIREFTFRGCRAWLSYESLQKCRSHRWSTDLEEWEAYGPWDRREAALLARLRPRGGISS